MRKNTSLIRSLFVIAKFRRVGGLASLLAFSVVLVDAHASRAAHINPGVVATVNVGGSPTGVGVNFATNRIYIGNGGLSGLDLVQVIDGTSNSVIATIPSVPNPADVVVNPATNRVYVVNFEFFGGSVTVIDGATNAVIGTVPVGDEPRFAAVNPVTNRVYVANDLSENVTVIDGATNAVIATVAVGCCPMGIAVNPTTNRVYVAKTFSNTVSVIDGISNGVIATFPIPVVGFTPNVTVNALTNQVYVSSNGGGDSVIVIDGGTNTVSGTITVGSDPRGVDVNATTDRLYVANVGSSTVSVTETTGNTVISTVPLESGPFDTAVNPASDRVYLTGINAGKVFVLGDTVASTPGTVSLGGFIDSVGNLVGGSVLLLQNGPVPGGKATFGGNVQFKSGDPSPTGNVRYIDHVTGDDIKATSFTTLVISAGPCGSDTHAMIMGKATVNGVPNQDLRIDVDDCTKPGSQQPSTPDMLVIKTGPNQVYMNGGPLVEGDIRVGKTQ